MKLIVGLIAFLCFFTSWAQSVTCYFDLTVSHQYESGRIRNDTISYYFAESKAAIVIHQQNNESDLRLIFNFPDSTITGLYEMNGRKGGYILPMNKKYWPGIEYAFSAEKNPAQYLQGSDFAAADSCEPVVCKNNYYDGTFCVMPAIPLNITQLLAFQTVGAGEDNSDIDHLAECEINGFPKRAEFTLKRNDSRISLLVINFSDTFNQSVFTTDGYELFNMQKEDNQQGID